ncbi:orotate phosphoribosyltransferase [Desulfonatronospira sp.]|uniref:orotate phosphoribosyltransferase n=1 Tax=Desulfonatronospira sp. TaxID=1962951 RepID=UPI0025C201E2|nr:orotate phosphoribosyltransferase [Desulfonatronospira sp.]
MQTSDLKARLAGLLYHKSYQEGDFILTSGKKSDYYFDCKQTALHPEGAYLLGRIFLDMLYKCAEYPDGAGGMTLGADPLVSAVTVMSYLDNRPLPGFIVRKEPKGHGTGQFLEGMANFYPGQKVCLLEDVITTGGTLLTACQRVSDAGLEVKLILCVLDRQEGGTENILQAGYDLQCIFTRNSLLEAAKGA